MGGILVATWDGESWSASKANLRSVKALRLSMSLIAAFRLASEAPHLLSPPPFGDRFLWRRWVRAVTPHALTEDARRALGALDARIRDSDSAAFEGAWREAVATDGGGVQRRKGDGEVIGCDWKENRGGAVCRCDLPAVPFLARHALGFEEVFRLCPGHRGVVRGWESLTEMSEDEATVQEVMRR